MMQQLGCYNNNNLTLLYCKTVASYLAMTIITKVFIKHVASYINYMSNPK